MKTDKTIKGDPVQPTDEGGAGTKGVQQSERLQKVMANAGLGSRRALERLIKSGDVKVNNSVASIGQTVQTGDKISFDGKDWSVVDKRGIQRSLVYNKPTGEVTTRSDPQGRPTVFEKLPKLKGARWIAVGRLDINTSGLLLMTTDGELAHAMMHPSNKVDREYACRIFGDVDQEKLDRLKNGVMLDDGMAQFSDIQAAGGEEGNHWFHVTILEGRNREVRRLWASQDLVVSRLKRVRYGAVFLPKRLRMGGWAELTEKDHQVLREDVGLPSLPAQLTLKAGKDGHDEDRRRKQFKQKPKKKPTRYKNVDK